MGWELVGSWMSHDVPTDIGRYLGCDQIQELAESFGKPCLTATMQHGRISLPHSGTSVTAFQALRDLDSLRLNTQARISLWLQYATGNLRDIMSVWLVWGKSSSLRWHKGCATREWNQGFSWREVLGVVRVLITDPK